MSWVSILFLLVVIYVAYLLLRAVYDFVLWFIDNLSDD